MKIALGADHAGFKLKEKVSEFLVSLGHEVMDKGAFSFDPADDYPDFVFPVAHAVADGEADRGIIVGKSGEGEAMCANRVKGVRAALFSGGPKEIIQLSREHNDANVLSLGSDFVDFETAQEILPTWLSTPFSADERHVRRIKKLDA
jgi:ribose 5-phosphate isomerase B